jgi:hypothetical protein
MKMPPQPADCSDYETFSFMDNPFHFYGVIAVSFWLPEFDVLEKKRSQTAKKRHSHQRLGRHGVQ